LLHVYQTTQNIVAEDRLSDLKEPRAYSTLLMRQILRHTGKACSLNR